MTYEPLKARLIDDDAFDLRILPFGGPIPGPDGQGRDVELEYYHRKVNPYPEYFEKRPVLWHHGKDSLMKGSMLGYSSDFHEEEDGWWERVWLKLGDARVNMVKRLQAKAALYGSSGALHGHLVKRAPGGAITAWPHAETTLSTSPVNTFSVVRPVKAVLDDFDEAEITLDPSFRAVLAELDALRADLPATSLGEQAAKAGRELSSANLSEIDEWRVVAADFKSKSAALYDHIDALANRVRARYEPRTEGTPE